MTPLTWRSPTRRPALCGIPICCLAVVSTVFGPLHAQTSIASIANRPPPAFSSDLPRVGLPEGTFHGWCGQNDAFLMRDGREFRLHTRDGRPGPTLSIKPAAVTYDLRCGENGEDAVFRDDRRDTIDIYQFSMKTQTTALVASAGKKRSHPTPTISSSPNAHHIAYRPDTIDVAKLAIAPNLRVILVNGESVRWKSDSAMLFSTVASPITPQSNRNSYSQAIEVAHVETNDKRALGRLPHGYRLQDGVFVNGGRELLLSLKFYDDDLGNEDGVILRCSLSGFDCRPFVSEVRQVSMNEEADIAVTKWIFNRPPVRSDGHATIMPDRYVVQVIKRDSKVLAVAEFSAQAAFGVNATISPSGALVVVTWFVPDSQCQTNLGSTFCQMGVLLDLKGTAR